MRVISGKARGTKLNTLEGLDTRPTTDRVKEALFSVIAEYIPESRVLDLFSGSGALAIEALSRGALNAALVEKNFKAAEIIRFNLEKTKLTSDAKLYISDAFDFLPKTDMQYDIIFLDPPYRQGFCDKALNIISENNILSKGGIVVCETSYEEEITTDFALFKEKKYGKTKFMIYKGE